MAVIRLANARFASALLTTGLVFAVGCVEPFGGSNLQVDFSGGVQTPGLPADFGRPPPGTHYSFYAVKLEDDGNGGETSFAFRIEDFAINPLVNTSSPCFIENDESVFPGVHSAQYANRLVKELNEKYGLPGGPDPEDNFDPFNPPAGADPGDAIDVVTAEVRIGNLQLLQAGVKAVTSFSPAQYPGVDDTCSCDPAALSGLSDAELAARAIPAATCLEDDCSKVRRTQCRAFWREHPDFYEGNDEIFTVPHNGNWRGAVTGTDPRNNQFLGGAGFFVDENLIGTDALLVNWQYNCTLEDYENEDIGPDNCEPQYPDGFPDADKSEIGFHYLSGTTEQRTRGTLNASLSNRLFNRVTAEAVIFFDLNDDDVQF